MMYESNILWHYFYFLDDNVNSHKLPITNTNLYEATTSNVDNTVIEWLDDDTDENIHEDDILNVNIKTYHTIYILHKKQKQNVGKKSVIINCLFSVFLNIYFISINVHASSVIIYSMY